MQIEAIDDRRRGVGVLPDGRAHALHDIEQARSRMLGERLPEHGAEATDVLAQRGVEVTGSVSRSRVHVHDRTGVVLPPCERS